MVAGRWNKKIKVAVKQMQDGTMQEEDIVNEAEAMK